MPLVPVVQRFAGPAALFERAEREGAALRGGLRNDPQSRYGAVGGRSGN